MCGISGYIGNGSAFSFLYRALVQLQNRGYDSAGICTVHQSNMKLSKYASSDILALDKLKHDEQIHLGSVGCGHTRWKTHGDATDINAHPHVDYYGRFALVHNGIIENYESLKKFLISNGFRFVSETDTEVIVNLISYYYNLHQNVKTAIMETVKELEGTYALCIVHKDDDSSIYCIKRGSPLLVSVTNNFALIVSETAGFCNLVNGYICLNSDDLCILKKDKNMIKMETLHKYDIRKLDKNNDATSPHPYPHWTIKEINEQAFSCIRAITMGGRVPTDITVKLGGLNSIKDELIDIEHIIILGCGTSFHSSLIGMYIMREICNFITVQAMDGGEFTLNDLPTQGKTGVIFVTQSGETKDLHRCIELCKQVKNIPLKTIGVVNAIDSLIAREVDCGAYLHAGREVGVASTKAFSSQMIVLALIAIWFAQNQNISTSKRRDYIESIRRLQFDVQTTIDNNNENCKEIAKYLLNQTTLFILGKERLEAVAREGSLKIKEIGYLHAEGYSSSALKHGPYALLTPNTPVILLTPNDENFQRNQGVMEELKARNAYIIGISDVELSDKYNIKLSIPNNKKMFSLLSTIIIQLMAYHLAVLKGHNPDLPRNLAKCVTVF